MDHNHDFDHAVIRIRFCSIAILGMITSRDSWVMSNPDPFRGQVSSIKAIYKRERDLIEYLGFVLVFWASFGFNIRFSLFGYILVFWNFGLNATKNFTKFDVI